MRKTLIAAALLSAFAAAQAQTTNVDGGTSSPAIINVGISTVGPAGPHKPNYPGIAVDGTNYIDLDGISLSYLKVGTVAGFDHYFLPGYTHTDPSGGTITTHINWVRIPTAGEDAYFGLATNPGSPNSVHAAYYVGDRTAAAVPTSNTSYAVGGLLAFPATSASAPVELAGTLNLALSGTGTGSLSGTLNDSGSSHSLAINPAVANNVNIPAGTFNGLASYNGGSTTGSKVDGQFYGNGVGAGNSAVAGYASGGTGSGAYVAGFGGKN